MNYWSVWECRSPTANVKEKIKFAVAIYKHCYEDADSMGAWSWWPHPPSVNRKIFAYHLVQAAVSIVRNLDVVHYSGAAITLHIWRFQLVYIVVSVIG